MLRFFHAPCSASSLYVAVAALLLCLLAPAPPASAQRIISTDTTIDFDINDVVFVTGSPSPTVNLVDGGTIAHSLVAYDASTVNVSGGTIGNFLVVTGPNARLNVFGQGLSQSPPQTDVFGNPVVVLSGTLADGTPLDNSVFLGNGAQVSQITLVNPPVAVNDSAPAVRKGPTTLNVLANDSGGVTLTVSAVTNGSKGTAAINGDDTLTYTRSARAKGNLADSFTYTISDGFGGTATATVTIR
jgi:hypothetical protein